MCVIVLICYLLLPLINFRYAFKHFIVVNFKTENILCLKIYKIYLKKLLINCRTPDMSVP